MFFKGFFGGGGDLLLLEGVGYDLSTLEPFNYESEVLINERFVRVKRLGRFGHYVELSDGLYFSREMVELIGQELVSERQSIDLEQIIHNDLTDGFINHLITDSLINDYLKSELLNYFIINDYQFTDEQVKLLVDESTINPYSKTYLLRLMGLSNEQLMIVMNSSLNGFFKNLVFLNYHNNTNLDLSQVIKSLSNPKDKLFLINYLSSEFTPSLTRDLLRGVKSVWGCDSMSESIPFKEQALLSIVDAGYVMTGKQFDFIINHFSKDYLNKIILKSLINGYEPSSKQVNQLFSNELLGPLRLLFDKNLKLSYDEVLKIIFSDYSYGFKNAVLSLALRNGLKPDESLINELLSNKLINPLKWLVNHKYGFSKEQLSRLKELGLRYNRLLNWLKRF